jgi:hypothetical protein
MLQLPSDFATTRSEENKASKQQPLECSSSSGSPLSSIASTMVLWNFVQITSFLD